jgi:hypothetical protein
MIVLYAVHQQRVKKINIVQEIVSINPKLEGTNVFVNLVVKHFTQTINLI